MSALPVAAVSCRTEPADTSVGGTIALRRGVGVVRSTGGGALAAALARPLGLRQGRDVVATLTIHPLAGTSRERWTRRFGDRRWSSDCERTAGGLVEWIGPRRRRLVGLVLDLGVDGDASTLRLRSVRVCRVEFVPRGVRLVVVVRPRMNGGIMFRSTATVLGRPLVGYEGWLA